MTELDRVVIEQFAELQEVGGVKLSMKHVAVDLAREHEMDELQNHIEGLSESEYYEFILEIRRHL